MFVIPFCAMGFGIDNYTSKKSGVGYHIEKDGSPGVTVPKL